jgi:hypothetical protein
MRRLCSFVIAINFLALSWASAQTLAPGKPAGVQAAQMGQKEWLVLGGVGIVAAAVLIANAGSGDHAAVTTQPIIVTTTSSTST